MKWLVPVLTEFDVKYITINVPVRYGVEDMPMDFPFRRNGRFEITVDVETGIIEDWPEGVEFHLTMQVVDEGTYSLLDGDKNLIRERPDMAVPNDVVPGQYGDYIDLDIAKNGKILNWPSEPSFNEFLLEEEE